MTFLLLIAGLVAVIWGGLLFVRGGLVASGLAVLLAGSCFGYPFFHLAGGPLPITADRVLWAVLMGQLVLLWRWKRLEPLAIGKADVLLGAFLLVLSASTLTHDWRMDHAQPLSRLVFCYFLPAGMYVVGREATQNERTAKLLLVCLGVFGLYLAVTAIGETRQIWSVVWPRYIRSGEFPEFLGRGRGPLLNPAGCGFFQAVCFCALLLNWPGLRPIGRAGLLAATLLMCYGIYCTLTRSSWMGGVFSLCVLLGLTLPRNWRMTILGSGAIVGCLFVASQWESIISFKRDKQLSASDTADSAKLRPLLAKVAWNMFLDRPLLGYGYGQYLQENVNYVEDRSSDLPLSKTRPYVQHNVWLNLLVETGLAGMLLCTALLIVWGRNAWRIWRNSAAPGWARSEALLLLAAFAAYVPNAMFQDMAMIIMVNMLLFFLAGLSEGLRRYAPGPAASMPLPWLVESLEPANQSS